MRNTPLYRLKYPEIIVYARFASALALNPICESRLSTLIGFVVNPVLTLANRGLPILLSNTDDVRLVRQCPFKIPAKVLGVVDQGL